MGFDSDFDSVLAAGFDSDFEALSVVGAAAALPDDESRESVR